MSSPESQKEIASDVAELILREDVANLTNMIRMMMMTMVMVMIMTVIMTMIVMMMRIIL